MPNNMLLKVHAKDQVSTQVDTKCYNYNYAETKCALQRTVLGTIQSIWEQCWPVIKAKHDPGLNSRLEWNASL